jgi:hypothetical protein
MEDPVDDPLGRSFQLSIHGDKLLRLEVVSGTPSET